MERKFIITALTLGVALSCPISGFASVEMLKEYREVYTDLKPNCMYCHVDKLPKKEDGKHELNPYGLKVKEAIPAADKAMTAEERKAANMAIFKQLGRNEAGAETGK